MTQELKWYQPISSYEIKFDEATTTLPRYTHWWGSKENEPYVHSKRDACPICWMFTDHAYERLQIQRWEDDGGI